MIIATNNKIISENYYVVSCNKSKSDPERLQPSAALDPMNLREWAEYGITSMDLLLLSSL